MFSCNTHTHTCLKVISALFPNACVSAHRVWSQNRVLHAIHTIVFVRSRIVILISCNYRCKHNIIQWNCDHFMSVFVRFPTCFASFQFRTVQIWPTTPLDTMKSKKKSFTIWDLHKCSWLGRFCNVAHFEL